MRIAIVTDAWFPQVNGVVRTLATLKRELERLGHAVLMVTPDRFRTLPCPTYPEIRLAVWARQAAGRLIEEFRADAVHIATEGPLGYAVRAWCLGRRVSFTTAYHTRFPEYVEARFAIPRILTYALLRRFHRPSAAVMVSTASIEADLAKRGFAHLRRWGRGVDLDLFRPRSDHGFDLRRPVLLYVGRVAVEKNVEAFLDLDVAGTKLVVGDGPMLDTLRRRYPNVHFAGARSGEDLARYYAAADAFVFPSRTDTFGLVMLEALACGVPVAAYPVPGPIDVLDGAEVGVLDEDLGRAVTAALTIPREACRAFAARFSWRESAEQFLGNLQPGQQ